MLAVQCSPSFPARSFAKTDSDYARSYHPGRARTFGMSCFVSLRPKLGCKIGANQFCDVRQNTLSHRVKTHSSHSALIMDVLHSIRPPNDICYLDMSQAVHHLYL